MKINKKYLYFIILAFFIALIFNNQSDSKATSVSYNQFIMDLKSRKIQKIDIQNSYTRSQDIYYKFDKNSNVEYKVSLPPFAQYWDDFFKNPDNYKNIEINTLTIKEESALKKIILMLLPIVLMFFVLSYFMKNQMGGLNKKFNLKVVNPNNIESGFDDIQGIDEVKLELLEIRDMFSNSEKYKKAGAIIPKGVILSGGPGTGKTMIAKALAKESGINFISVSGSSFVEMFVGLGSSRVRALFDEAEKHSPCIIFIDEFDAIGGKRSSGGGNDERESTLNELLVKMDGLTSNKNVFILAATNRLDMLDPAILRAGRFDRKINVPLPDVDGRKKMLLKLIEKRKYKISDEINFDKFSQKLYGFSGASITNLLNEASIISVRRNLDKIDLGCIEEAYDKVTMGIAVSFKMTDEDKLRTARHEAGHATVALFIPNCDAITKVTIEPRSFGGGFALGVTHSTPNEDRVHHTEEQLRNEISVLLGGYCAEKIYYNNNSTGASNDIKVITDIAMKMVTIYGLNSFDGLTQRKYFDDNYHLSQLSESKKSMIDNNIDDIISEQKEKTIKLLEDNKDVIDAMSKMLMEKEIINDDDIDEILASLNKTKLNKNVIK